MSPYRDQDLWKKCMFRRNSDMSSREQVNSLCLVLTYCLYSRCVLSVLISSIKYHVVAHPLSLVLVRTFSAYIDKIAKQQQSSM